MIVRCYKCHRQFEFGDWPDGYCGDPPMCGKCAQELRGAQRLYERLGKAHGKPPVKQRYKVCPHCDGLGKVVKEQTDDTE